jgi:hypothetical protein
MEQIQQNPFAVIQQSILEVTSRLEAIESRLLHLAPSDDNPWQPREDFCKSKNISYPTAARHADMGIIDRMRLGKKVYYRLKK